MPTPLYGSETWTLTEHDKYRITAAEMRNETNRNIHALRPQKKARYSERNQNAAGLEKKCKNRLVQYVSKMDRFRLRQVVVKCQQAGLKKPKMPIEETSGRSQET